MWFTKSKRSKGLKVSDRGSMSNDTKNDDKIPVEEIQLIKGNFNAVEAADILLSMINDKIKYHTVKSLNLNQSREEQNYSKQRIAQLRDVKKTVTDLVIEANKTGHRLQIEGTVKICVKDDNTNISY